MPTGMLRLRDQNGSHSPHEAMDTPELMATVEVLARWIADDKV